MERGENLHLCAILHRTQKVAINVSKFAKSNYIALLAFFVMMMMISVNIVFIFRVLSVVIMCWLSILFPFFFLLDFVSFFNAVYFINLMLL